MAHPEAIAHYPESFQLLIKDIHNRVESGKNALIGVFGQTGGGKSLASLQIMIGLYLYRHGEMPTNDYLIKHTFFKAKDFLVKMNAKELTLKEENLWDEAGVDVGHKSHASTQNKVIGWLAQTFRNLQQVVIFTTPSISFIDASVRKLLHYYIEVVNIDKKEKMCIIKPLKMQYNVRMDKIYYHNIKVKGKGGYIEEVSFAKVPKVSDEIEKSYENVKNKFTGDLNQKIQDLLEKIEEKENPTPKVTQTKPLTERQDKILQLLKEGITSGKEISKRLGVVPSCVSENLSVMRRKGINVDVFLGKVPFLMNSA